MDKVFRIFLLCLVNFQLVACFGNASHRSPGAELALEESLKNLLTVATKDLRLGTIASLERASASLELARDLSPNDSRVLDGLGCVEWGRENYKLAQYFFNRALEANPNYDRAYAHLALVAERRGDSKAAYGLLKIAVGLNPLNYRSRNNYAAVLGSQGYSQEAYRQLLRAYQAGGKDSAVVLSNLGNKR